LLDVSAVEIVGVGRGRRLVLSKRGDRDRWDVWKQGWGTTRGSGFRAERGQSLLEDTVD